METVDKTVVPSLTPCFNNTIIEIINDVHKLRDSVFIFMNPFLLHPVSLAYIGVTKQAVVSGICKCFY